MSVARASSASAFSLKGPNRTKLRRILSVALVIIALTIAGFLLYRITNRYSLDDIRQTLAAIPGIRIALAILFAVASYTCLTAFDYLGLRYAGKPQPYRFAALASFVSLSFGHNIGMFGFSSGAIRYRFYSRCGLDVGDVAKVTVFSGTTVALGLMVLGGLALTFQPQRAQQFTGLSEAIVLTFGGACLALALAYVLLSAFVRESLCFRRWTIELPKLPLALGQIVLGAVNFACVAACLYQGLAAQAEVAYLDVASVYVIAQVATLITHMPGGLGVIESTVIFLLPKAEVIGALILFRCIYFILPLCLGSIAFIASEMLLPDIVNKGAAAPAHREH